LKYCPFVSDESDSEAESAMKNLTSLTLLVRHAKRSAYKEVSEAEAGEVDRLS
jgi:hypothetical protein